MRLKNPNKTTHCDHALLCMNFLIMNSSSQKRILCAHYYHQHGIKMLFVISHLLLLMKTLANESNKASVKIQQGSNNSWVMNEISCCVSQPITTEVTQHTPQHLWYARAHQKQNPPNWSTLSPGSYSTSKVNQKVKQPVSKTQDQEEQVPKIRIHAPFCMTSEQLQPCEPKT